MRNLVNRRYIPVLVLVIALFVAGLIMITAPETRKQEPAKAVPAVTTLPLERGDYGIKVEAFGSVIPAREVTLLPEVTGKIVEVHSEVEPGGRLKEGDIIIQIERADYELAVERAAAALREAEASLELEKGRQVVAKREWEIFGKEIDPSLASSELALRKPQLAQAEADVKSAAAALEEAKLNLERTAIRAPFDSIVLEDNAEIGQRVDPDTGIIRLAGTESFWVNASVPLDSYRLIEPGDGDEGSTVAVYLDSGLGDTVTRCGKVIRKLGDLDPEGRMGRVLISIDDPLSIEGGTEKTIPLESYVRVEISAGSLSGVYKIPRRGIRENNTVWVAGSDNRLAIKDVKIVWRYKDDVYIRDGFSPGDRLITSHLASVIPGMEVVLRDDGESEVSRQVASTNADAVCGKED